MPDGSAKYNDSEDSAMQKASEDSGNCKSLEDSTKNQDGGRRSSDSERYKEFLTHMDILVSGKDHCDTDFMEISKQVILMPVFVHAFLSY